jgi:hypothetical protein
VENQQSICSQKDNDVGVIPIQNSREPHAGVAERRNVIAYLRPAFGCEDRNSRCSGRSLCGLSKLQLGARLGIETADVSAYEQGEKRMSCKLLLETAKQLKATPRFFFQ